MSEELGSTHWYLRLLRDEGSAAERLAHTLARSRYAADLLVGAPESVAILGDAGGLTPISRDDLIRRMRAAAGRQADPDKAVRAARSIRRQELFRIAVADLSGSLDLDGVGRALTDLTAALVETALQVAIQAVEAKHGPLVTDILVVGMGRLGGAEMAYGSDADVLFVHDPLEGAERGSRAGAGARDRAGAASAPLLGRSRPAAGSGRRPATRGQERTPRAQPAQLPRLLRSLVAHLGVAGAAARHPAGR